MVLHRPVELAALTVHVGTGTNLSGFDLSGVGLWNLDNTPTLSTQTYQGYLPNSENGSAIS